MYKLPGIDFFLKKLIQRLIAELRRVKHKDLETMTYRIELAYDEVVDILEKKHIAGSSIGYTLPSRICKNGDLNLMLKSLFPRGVKVNVTIDDI